MNWQDYIEEVPDVMMGKPVFKGTRLTVEHVLQELANGVPEEEVLVAYPRLTKQHLHAALAYAAVLHR
jgi:uncharacterized protein (DUF433 family)